MAEAVPIDTTTDIDEWLEKARKASRGYKARGGYYVGPRGGKWADPQHKVPWDPAKAQKPSKAKGTSEEQIEASKKEQIQFQRQLKAHTKAFHAHADAATNESKTEGERLYHMRGAATAAGNAFGVAKRAGLDAEAATFLKNTQLRSKVANDMVERGVEMEQPEGWPLEPGIGKPKGSKATPGKKGTPHPEGYLSTGPKGAGSKKLMAAGKAMDTAWDHLHWATNDIHSSVNAGELSRSIPRAEQKLKAARDLIAPLRAAVEARGHDVERKRLASSIESLDGAARTIAMAKERMAKEKAREAPKLTVPTHRGQADYEDIQEAKVERKEAHLAKLEREAASREASAKQMSDVIPMGQPILVGHHSEKRHRRDLERINQNTRKAIEADEKARKLKVQLTTMGKAGGSVSSDDPKAVVKLKEKLAKMEQTRAEYKKLNAAFRKHKGDWDAIQAATGLSDKTIAKTRKMMEAAHWEKKPIPAYAFTNLSANIRRTQKRIDELAKEATHTKAEPVQGNGWEVEEDLDDNRIWVTFDQKPPREVTRMMRSNGFKWSPTRTAWVRQLNANGRYAAGRVAKDLGERMGTAPAQAVQQQAPTSGDGDQVAPEAPATDEGETTGLDETLAKLPPLPPGVDPDNPEDAEAVLAHIETHDPVAPSEKVRRWETDAQGRSHAVYTEKSMTTNLDDWMEKARGHKYVSRKKVKGKWVYEYKDASGKTREVKSRGASGKEWKAKLARATTTKEYLEAHKEGLEWMEARTVTGSEPEVQNQRELVRRFQERVDAQTAAGEYEPGTKVQYQGTKGEVLRTQGDMTIVQFEGSGTTGEGILTERLEPISEPVPQLQPEAKGGYEARGEDHMVDSKFVQEAMRIPGISGKHVGFGDFELRRPSGIPGVADKTIYIGRTGNEMAGTREHQMSGDPDLIAEVLSGLGHGPTGPGINRAALMNPEMGKSMPEDLDDWMEKSKYLKRTGTPGNYKYEYAQRPPHPSKKNPALGFPGEDGERAGRKGAFKVSSAALRAFKEEASKGPHELAFKKEREALDEVPREALPALFGADNMPDAQDAIARDTKGAFRQWMTEVSKVSPKVGRMLRAKSELAPIYFYSHMKRVSGKDMADIAFKRTFETDSGHPGELNRKSKVEKSMTTNLDEWMEKAGGLPSHAARMGGPKSNVQGGSQDGASLEKLGKTPDTTGPGGKTKGCDKDGKPTGVPGAEGQKLSEDDEEVKDQLKTNRKKPLELTTQKSLSPASQRDMVARETAVLASRMRKGEEPITFGPSAHPLGNAQTYSQDPAELVKSEDDTMTPMSVVRGPTMATSGVLCKSIHAGGCDHVYSAMLTACPGCGAGLTQHRVLPSTFGIGLDMSKSHQTGLRPAKRPPMVSFKGK